MTKKDILDAYSILRTTDGTIEAIPYEVIEYMRDAAIEKLEEEYKLFQFRKEFKMKHIAWRTKPNT